MEHRDLGDDEDGRHLGKALGEQQPEVGFVVNRTERVTHSRGHDGIDSGEHSVEGGHHDAIADLCLECLVTCHMGAEPQNSFKGVPRDPLYGKLTTRHHRLRDYVSPN